MIAAFERERLSREGPLDKVGERPPVAVGPLGPAGSPVPAAFAPSSQHVAKRAR